MKDPFVPFGEQFDKEVLPPLNEDQFYREAERPTPIISETIKSKNK